MLFSVYGARGIDIHATDGRIGTLDDFYFDDATWRVRYAVIDTGGWLTGRKVLLAPSALGALDPSRGALSVTATRAQVEDSPGIDSDKPVSRQYEERLHGHYGWTPYWGFGATTLVPPATLAPGYAYPGTPGRVETSAAAAEVAAREAEEADPHLRSAREVTGYSIRARDGDIGHVEDFLADSEAWAIRYMIVDTKSWWPGKKVPVSPQWIESVSWTENTVRVGMTREQIKGSPEYDPTRAVDRDYERRLFDHYGLAPYW